MLPSFAGLHSRQNVLASSCHARLVPPIRISLQFHRAAQLSARWRCVTDTDPRDILGASHSEPASFRTIRQTPCCARRQHDKYPVGGKWKLRRAQFTAWSNRPVRPCMVMRAAVVLCEALLLLAPLSGDSQQALNPKP